MAVDVVVVSYKTDDLLVDFVHSFHRSKRARDKLFVIDVESTDRIIPTDLVTVDKYKHFHGNIGYGRACNEGATYGTNDVILLANADTLLTDPGLQECHDALMAHDDWGVLGPRQVNENNQITAGGIFGTDTNIGQRGWNEVDNGQYSDIREDAKSVSGSLYFIKRSLWQELTDCPIYKKFTDGATGAFLPTNHYYEETACSYHARAHGYKIVYYGPVQMVHLWHKASQHGGWADQQVEVSKQTMRHFCQQHGIICE